MLPRLPLFPGGDGRRDWRAAFEALGRLLADGDDTVQVFRIMRALNTDQGPRNHARLLATLEGGRLLCEQPELAPQLSDPAYIAGFAPGTVGAAYRDFLIQTGYSAAGLVAISREGWEADTQHPYVWFGRRIRDLHDVWHVLTGYQADEHLGESALVAFSYAQLGGLGWAFIAAAASLKSLSVARSTAFARAVWEGYRNGRRAAWLPGEDYSRLLAEPLDAARARLRIREPLRYREAQAALGPAMAAMLSKRHAVSASAITPSGGATAG